MTTNTFSISSLLSNCDRAFSSTGTYGYMTLLSGALSLGVSYTVNSSTGTFTTGTAHALVTGSRIRMVGGTVPSPLVANTDYFVIKTSATSFKLADTLASTDTNTSIVLTDAGSGALTYSEQALTVADPLTVLVNKEIVHPSWTSRALLADLGNAVNNAGVAEKPIKSITISNSSAQPIDYLHYLTIESATASAIGSSPIGIGYLLSTEPSNQTVLSGNSRIVSLKLKARASI